jgi:outer membrane protein
MKVRASVFVVSFLFVFQFAQAQEEITLEQVIGLALQHNYDVKVARTINDAAETDKKYVWGAFLPQVNGQASTTRNRNEQEIRVLQRETDEIVTLTGPTASNNLNGSLNAVWTLFDGTRMFATKQRIDRIAEQGELVVKDQMTNTIASIITNYYDIVRQKQQLKAIQEQMSVSEERVKLAERKLQVGTGVKPELLQAKVDYNAQRTQVLQQESIIAQLKEQLNALVGTQLPQAYDVADTIVIDLGMQPDVIPSNIEESNYSLLVSRENVRIARLAVREQRADYLPVVNFNSSLVYSRTDNTKMLNPYGTFYAQQEGYNYGLSVAIPILNGFNTRRLTQQARIEFGRQTLLYDQLKINVNTGLKNAYVNYDNARKILLIEEETIGLAKENVYIALESFKRGLTTFIELRTAQQSLAEAYNRLISARYNTKVAETELLRLKGSLLK